MKEHGLAGHEAFCQVFFCYFVAEVFMEILKIGLILGIVGHAINMWCDRVLSITPNGKLTFANMDNINDPQKMAELYEGVNPSVPMKSAILGAFALFLHYFGYISIACFIGTYSNILGAVLFVCATFFAILGTGHHVKYALSVWVFIKGGRDEKAYALFTGLYHGGNVTKLCYLGYIGYILTLILAIFMNIGVLPLWAFTFTVLPIFIVLFPFKIIGSLHISAIITFLGWMFLIIVR